MQQRIIVILGMHRSGTSCLAGTLQEAGLYLGEVHTENPFNRKGNRENPSIMALHEDILAHSEGSWHQPPAGCHWLQQHIARRDTIIASYRNAHSTFCEFVADEQETKEIASGTRQRLSRPPRFFTPREVARLQGFPESFVTEWCETSYVGSRHSGSYWTVSLQIELSKQLR